MKINLNLKLDLKKKLILSLFIFLLVIYILVQIIVLPTIREIKKISYAIETQRLDLEKRYLKGQNLKQLRENLNKIEPQLDKLNRIFINQNRELEFITTLEETAAANKIFQKINLGAAEAVPAQRFKKIPLQLSAQGNFINQMNYLLKLEALDYYINIKTLELSPAPTSLAENGTSLSNINLLMTADTYWQ